MQDFRVNTKRQEIVLIVAHQQTDAECLFKKTEPKVIESCSIGFFERSSAEPLVGPRGSRCPALSLV